jgi:hypothetical protein
LVGQKLPFTFGPPSPGKHFNKETRFLIQHHLFYIGLPRGLNWMSEASFEAGLNCNDEIMIGLSYNKIMQIPDYASPN